MALRKAINHKQKLEQDLEHITQELYRHNKELADTNRTLSLLRTIDSLVLESHDSIKVLSEQIVAAISRSTEYPLVAIYGASSLGTDKLELFGLKLTGFELDQSALLDIKPTTKHRWFKNKDKYQLVSLSRVKCEDLQYFLGCSAETVNQMRQAPIKSVYLAKMIARQKLAGLLVIGSSGLVSDFTTPSLNLLERLAEATGIALDNKLLFEENQQVLQQLRKANSRLKELDRTKDEFISMASHQLRTPLTTIKGYLSMILEGDAGAVNEKQQPLIVRAYDSAQNMVDLIGDLLNVSRLQSGKFVIENKPTQLADLIEAEVRRLGEQAEARNIQLAFHKPSDIPLLGLDATKIRQVVMNFLDNALFYTPKGGSVTVELKSTPESVIYTVTDTGVGVPKAAQHHLFSKFYRADNAKKMRPDGTGLGLFMAKKVVVAQGGAVIFKSEEGKGSIFGFSFPRKSLEVKS
jgi:signal transduction histidine kinase